MKSFPADRVYVRVLHVKNGYEEREAHIRREFSPHGIPVDFYLDWDVSDFAEEELRRFVGSSHMSLPAASCAMKHIGIWREFLKTDLPYCLVLEDDVFLAADFNARLNTCLAELGDPSRKAVVYIGNAGNYYISAFRLRRGQHLYPAQHCRATDSYVITRSVASERCAWFDVHELGKPIDHQVNHIDREIGAEILWFERPFVEQGSQSGFFRSSIEFDARGSLWSKRVEWLWKKYRRRLLGRSNT
jgi:glycosyl transferase family 25